MNEHNVITVQRKRWSVGTLTYTMGGLATLFCWLLWGDFANSMKDRSVAPVFQLLLRRFQASDMLAGTLIGTLPAFLHMLVSPYISYKSDRYRSRWGRRIPFLLIPTPFIALAMVGLAFSPAIGVRLHDALGAHSPGVNASVLIAMGVFWVLFELATMTAGAVFGGLINDVVPRPLLGRFFGLFRAISLGAGITFNFWLMGTAEASYFWIFVGVGMLFAAGFAMMCVKVKEGEYPPPPIPAPGQGGPFHAMKTYFVESFGKSYYLLFFATMTLAGLAFVPVNLFSVFYAKSINLDMGLYGKLVASSYMVSLILAYLLGMIADRFHPLPGGLVVMTMYGIVMLWGGFFATTVQAVSIAFVAHTILSGTFFTVTASIWQCLLPKTRFAQYASAGGIISGICGMVFGPLLGVFLDHTGHTYRYTFLISGVLAMSFLAAGLVLQNRFVALGGRRNYIAPE